SKYDYTSNKQLFKRIKDGIPSTKAKSFLYELCEDSETYKNIFDVRTRAWNKNEYPLRDSLSALYRFGVTQQTPMILAIMREYFAGRLRYKHALEAVRATEHFHFIFT